MHEEQHVRQMQSKIASYTDRDACIVPVDLRFPANY